MQITLILFTIPEVSDAYYVVYTKQSAMTGRNCERGWIDRGIHFPSIRLKASYMHSLRGFWCRAKFPMVQWVVSRREPNLICTFIVRRSDQSTPCVYFFFPTQPPIQSSRLLAWVCALCVPGYSPPSMNERGRLRAGCTARKNTLISPPNGATHIYVNIHRPAF